jgi:hypothetical protein
LLRKSAIERAVNILRQKASLARPQGKQVHRIISEGLQIAVAKSALGQMNLALRPAQDIAIVLKDFVLIDALKGEDEALGFAALNWTALRCLIEIQTLGRALARGRASTRTDFALVAPFIDDVLRSMPLKGLSARLQEALKGLRLRFPAKDPDALSLWLSSYHFTIFQNSFSVEDVADNLVIRVGVSCEIMSLGVVMQNGEGLKLGAQTDLMSLQANLRAELHRFSIPWYALEKWRKGTILPLPQTVFDNAPLRPEGGAAPLPVRLEKIGLRRAVVLNALETELTEPVSNPVQGESQGGSAAEGQ